jgi:uncharacterized protein YndB with AHSA1/START domain
MDVKATKTKTAFRMEVGVGITIGAKPEKIWALLTDAPNFPKWNSTVSNIEGQIAEGQKIKVKVPITTRVFPLKVTGVVANQTMQWSDGMAPMFRGVRTFTLTPRADGTTDFAMNEVFAGLMLPMIAGSLPDFVPVFEQYAKDLKKAAEA